ncbi:MAG TPA: hypothetical protein VGM50_00815 [Gemmatimonadaceae bacterium]
MSVRTPVRIAVAFLGLTACHQRREPPDLMDDVIVERIIHGNVAIVGAANDQHEMLQTGNGPIRLYPSRTDSIALLRVEGLEVAVRGVEESGGLRMERFTVTAIDGKPVLDGIVRIDGTGCYLEVPKKKRLAIANAPDVFKVLNGARIWLSGPLESGPYQYGVIVP